MSSDLTPEHVRETLDAYRDPAAYALANDDWQHPELECFARALPEGLVVDLGAGTGRDARRLQRLGHLVLAVDAAPEMVEHLVSNGVPALRADLRDLVDVPDQLAGAWVNASLLHLSRSSAHGVFGGVADRLQVGGHLMVGVKAGTGSVTDLLDGRKRHTTLYQADEIADLASRSGLGVVHVTIDQGDPRGVSWIYLHAVK